jgi:hypothetical protein
MSQYFIVRKSLLFLAHYLVPICTPHKILFRCLNQYEGDGRACSTYGGGERCRQGFGVKYEEKDHLEELSVKWVIYV